MQFRTSLVACNLLQASEGIVYPFEIPCHHLGLAQSYTHPPMGEHAFAVLYVHPLTN